MSTFTKQFKSPDDYEDWLRGVGDRIHVLTIYNASPSRNLSVRQGQAPVVVKFETKDKTLGPQKTKTTRLLQIVAVGVLFWGVFIYAIKLFF